MKKLLLGSLLVFSTASQAAEVLNSFEGKTDSGGVIVSVSVGVANSQIVAASSVIGDGAKVKDFGMSSEGGYTNIRSPIIGVSVGGMNKQVVAFSSVVGATGVGEHSGDGSNTGTSLADLLGAIVDLK